MSNFSNFILATQSAMEEATRDGYSPEPTEYLPPTELFQEEEEPITQPGTPNVEILEEDPEPEVEVVYTFTPNRKRARGDEPIVGPLAPPAPKKTKLVACCSKVKAERLNGVHSTVCLNRGTQEAYLVAMRIEPTIVEI